MLFPEGASKILSHFVNISGKYCMCHTKYNFVLKVAPGSSLWRFNCIVLLLVVTCGCSRAYFVFGGKRVLRDFGIEICIKRSRAWAPKASAWTARALAAVCGLTNDTATQREYYLYISSAHGCWLEMERWRTSAGQRIGLDGGPT